jgi:hypothetical protein
MSDLKSQNQLINEEIIPHAANGMLVLIIDILLMLLSLVLFFYDIIFLKHDFNIPLIILSALYLFLVGPMLFAGLKILKR